MKLFQRTIYRISCAAAVVSALICVSMLVLILVEIVLRSFFDTSTFLMDEFVGYGVGAMAFLALGYSLESGSLIRVNLLLKRFRGRVRQGVEIVCTVTTLFAMGVPIWFFWLSIMRHYKRGYTSGTYADVPAYIPEGILLIGMILFWIQLLAYGMRVVAGQVDLSSERAVDLGGK